MISPVRCTFCGETYDLANVEVTAHYADCTAHYADCTVFKTPCCGKTADDRTFKSLPDFTRVDEESQRRTMFDSMTGRMGLDGSIN